MIIRKDTDQLYRLYLKHYAGKFAEIRYEEMTEILEGRSSSGARPKFPRKFWIILGKIQNFSTIFKLWEKLDDFTTNLEKKNCRNFVKFLNKFWTIDGIFGEIRKII